MKCANFLLRQISLVIGIVFVFANLTYSQVGIGTLTPDSTAILHLESQNRGFLAPRLTTSQQQSIKNPAVGLLIFNLDSLRFYFYNGDHWLSFSNNVGDTIDYWECGMDLKYAGQSYATVKIGSQCWFAENLNIGSRITSPTPQSDNGVIEKYCYNNVEDSCDIYGGLYQWDEMMQYIYNEGTQGICPNGWHVASDGEWKTLEGTVDSQYPDGDPEWDDLGWRGQDVGDNLRDTSLRYWNSASGATNSSGFSLRGAGYYNGNSQVFYTIRHETYTYTSTIASSGFPYFRYFAGSQVWRQVIEDIFTNGFFIRCLKNIDGSNYSPSVPSNPSPENTAVNQPLDISLSWTCQDPENDLLTYDIYFDTQPEPVALAASDYSTTTYDLTYSLSPAFTYYWKVVATDDHGNTTSGPVWSFSTAVVYNPCPDAPTVTDADGNVYNTVLIGDQCWMKENLNVGLRVDLNDDPSNNGIIEKYCYDDLISNCDKYGGLYVWNEMMQYVTTEGAQGICPEGWHIPADGEWKVLEGNVDSQYGVGDPVWNIKNWRGSDVGKNLKSTYDWFENGNGIDLYGFCALPGGEFNNGAGNHFYNNQYQWAEFWTSTLWDSNHPWYRKMRYDLDQTYHEADNIEDGFSVRCLKD